MKDNFDKALNADSISMLENSTSRPIVGLTFTEKQLSEFAKTLDIDNVTALTQGTGRAVVNVFNNFLLANQQKAKNARLKIDDSGNIVLRIGNKDISLGNETNLNTNDIALTIQQEVANFKPNSMSNFN